MNSYHVSDVLRIRPHRVSSCRSLDHFTQEEIVSPSFSLRPLVLIKTCFDRSSTSFKTSLLFPNSKTIIDMNENMCSSHRFGSNLDPSGVGGSSDFPGYSQCVGATILVLCDSRTLLCSVSTLGLLSVLRHTTRKVLVVLQTNLGRHPRAGMLCVRHWQLCCGLILDRCLCRVSSQPASFSETVTVLVKISRAVCALTSTVVLQD